MKDLIFTYECKVDDKGRIMLPGDLKKDLEPLLHEGFILKKAIFQDCLELYPTHEYLKQLERVKMVDMYSDDTDLFVTKFLAYNRSVEVDNSGRILIPKDMLAQVRIEKEVVLASMITKIRIWNKKTYEQVLADDRIDFRALTRKVMQGVDQPRE